MGATRETIPRHGWPGYAQSAGAQRQGQSRQGRQAGEEAVIQSTPRSWLMAYPEGVEQLSPGLSAAQPWVGDGITGNPEGVPQCARYTVSEKFCPIFVLVLVLLLVLDLTKLPGNTLVCRTPTYVTDEKRK